MGKGPPKPRLAHGHSPRERMARLVLKSLQPPLKTSSQSFDRPPSWSNIVRYASQIPLTTRHGLKNYELSHYANKPTKVSVFDPVSLSLSCITTLWKFQFLLCYFLSFLECLCWGQKDSGCVRVCSNTLQLFSFHIFYILFQKDT